MKPVRVLQVVGSMNRGGIETWLMHVLRRINRSRFQIDFLVSNLSRSPLQDEIRDLGSSIYVCMAHSQPFRYARNLTRFFYSHEPYDIVHSHLHNLNGLVSTVAALSRVPARIVHSHFNIAGADMRSVRLSPRYRVSRLIMRISSTGELACSAAAGEALYGPGWDRLPNNRVMLAGIDPAQFSTNIDKRAIRANLNIPAHAIVVGHAGRFVPEKNHAFLLRVAVEYLKCNPNAYFLLIGEGPLKAALIDEAAAHSLPERVQFAGMRSDVPQLMTGAMDCFLFPSLSEAAPMALVEAQAAGLPCVYSDVIPPETCLYKPGLWPVSLNSGPDVWAETIQCALKAHTPAMALASRLAVEASPFNIERALESLENYYLQVSGRLQDVPASQGPAGTI